MPVNTLIQLRRGTKSAWDSAPVSPGRGILYQGELGYELDTGKIKIGDGTTYWGSGLCYASVPLNSSNFISGSGININLDSSCSSGVWSIDESWLANFIATSSGSLNVEGVQDIIGNSGVVGGFGIDKDYNDGTGLTTVSVTGMALRVAESTGIGVSVSTESNNNVYTVSVTGIDHTLITDWDAALSGNIDTQLLAGSGIDFAYDSGNNTLTISTSVLDETHTHLWDNITDAKVKASLTELGYLSGVVPGSGSADRVLVLDSSKDIDGIRNLTATDTITATTFSGALVGDLTSSNVDINGGSIDGTVIGANSPAVISGTSIYASTGFVGDLTGNASSATNASNVTVASTNSAGPYYINFVDGTSGSQAVEVDSNLTYNASTNTLSAGNVSVTGTVSANHVGSATLTTTGNVTVGGDLTVAGTTTTVNSTVVEIGDNIIRVNTSGLPTGGLEVRNSGTTDYKQFVWDNVDSRWELGSENLQANRFVSTVADGTSPLVVTSTTAVTNLNADYLDGQHGSYYLDWGNFSNLPDPVVTVGLSGDVVGTGTYTWTNLSGDPTITLNTVIQPNSVALGTDTTGQYASTVSVAGTGLSATTPAASDGTAYTITSNATPANTTGSLVSRDTSTGGFSAGDVDLTRLDVDDLRIDGSTISAQINDTDISIFTSGNGNIILGNPKNDIFSGCTNSFLYDNGAAIDNNGISSGNQIISIGFNRTYNDGSSAYRNNVLIGNYNFDYGQSNLMISTVPALNRFSTMGSGTRYSTIIGSVSQNTIHSGDANIIVGGAINDIYYGNYSTVLSSRNSIISGDYSVILGGYGSDNGGYDFVQILGSGITATQSHTTFVENLISVGDVSGVFTGDGSSITDIDADNISSGTLNSSRLPTVTQTNTSTGPTASFVSSVTRDSYGRVTGVNTTTHDLATTTVKGIASFNTNDFSVSSGAVSIKTSGVSNTQLVNDSVTFGTTEVALGASSSRIDGLVAISGASAAVPTVLTFCTIDGGTP